MLLINDVHTDDRLDLRFHSCRQRYLQHHNQLGTQVSGRQCSSSDSLAKRSRTGSQYSETRAPRSDNQRDNKGADSLSRCYHRRNPTLCCKCACRGSSSHCGYHSSRPFHPKRYCGHMSGYGTQHAESCSAHTRFFA